MQGLIAYVVVLPVVLIVCIVWLQSGNIHWIQMENVFLWSLMKGKFRKSFFSFSGVKGKCYKCIRKIDALV